MSSTQRYQPVGVISRLFQQPHRFDFFQAVRLLERWFVQQERLSPSDVLASRLSFHSSLSLSFPASEIAAFHVVPQSNGPACDADVQARDVLRIDMSPAFMGLLGAGGALPTLYTEMLAQRESQQRDASGRAFIDIFLHRSIALFYQAWRKHRLPLQFEADRRNSFLPLVLSLAGVGQAGLRQRLRPRDGGVADDALAFFAGALQQRPMSAALLQGLLAQYLGVPVGIEQFIGRWFSLPVENQAVLGRANMQLGRDALVGERMYQRDLRARVTLGPLDQQRFERFLPGGAGAIALHELLTLVTGATLEYEVRLTLHADDIKGMRLQVDAPAPRLGWNSFLVTRPVVGSRSDAGYALHALH